MGSFTKEIVTSTTNVPGDPGMDCVEELYYRPRRTRSMSPDLHSQTLTSPRAALTALHFPLPKIDWLDALPMIAIFDNTAFQVRMRAAREKGLLLSFHLEPRMCT